MNEAGFDDLIRRIQAGDEEAAAELVRRYEPEVRLAARRMIKEKRLAAKIDSMDIAQSVFLNFFIHAADGDFGFEAADDLAHLLVKMARNRVRDRSRREGAEKRGGGRLQSLEERPAEQASPSQIVAGQEIFLAFREILSDEERYLADERARGRSWADLARELATKPDTLRMRLARAVDRASRELRLR